jgi:hypothetical protein
MGTSAALSEQYRGLTDEELLRIAADRDNLTDLARLALDTELARRKLSDTQIKEFVAENERLELREHAREQAAQDRERWYWKGVGKMFYGRDNYAQDPPAQV